MVHVLAIKSDSELEFGLRDGGELRVGSGSQESQSGVADEKK